jgi:hypothetical protein
MQERRDWLRYREELLEFPLARSRDNTGIEQGGMKKEPWAKWG